MSKVQFNCGNRVVHVSLCFVLKSIKALSCVMRMFHSYNTSLGLELMQLWRIIFPTSLTCFWNCSSVCISALIPLAEFSDPHVAKTYAVSPDKETLEILNQMSNQRGVRVILLLFLHLPITLESQEIVVVLRLLTVPLILIGCTGWSPCKDTLRWPCKEAVWSSWPGSPQLLGGWKQRAKHTQEVFKHLFVLSDHKTQNLHTLENRGTVHDTKST